MLHGVFLGVLLGIKIRPPDPNGCHLFRASDILRGRGAAEFR